MKNVNQTELPQIKVRFLWHNNWWDGPLMGMCEYQGQMYWYVLHNENYKRRRYVVVKLTSEELETEIKWNDLFIAKVGNHFQCDEFGNIVRGKVQPSDLHHEFYNKFKKWTRPCYEEKPDRIIGFFDIYTR